MATKAANLLIARRADTRARADIATWKMMAKLNGASALPAEAQDFLESYKTLLKETPAAAATDATIRLIYQSYYAEMSGAGVRPEVPAQSTATATNNFAASKRPPLQPMPAPPQTPQG